MKLILASTSRYRQSLLARLQLPFESRPPNVDESALPVESAQNLALRLAQAKAAAVAASEPAAWVIGSDQVASLGDTVLGKPGTHPVAMAQLQACSGRDAIFYTAVALHCAGTGYREALVHATRVRFRPLSPREIAAYLEREQPYDCAGSFKCEGLGIALFEEICSDDPTALEGLPLIATTRLLREAGIDALAPPQPAS